MQNKWIDIEVERPIAVGRKVYLLFVNDEIRLARIMLDAHNDIPHHYIYRRCEEAGKPPYAPYYSKYDINEVTHWCYYENIIEQTKGKNKDEFEKLKEEWVRGPYGNMNRAKIIGILINEIDKIRNKK